VRVISPPLASVYLRELSDWYVGYTVSPYSHGNVPCNVKFRLNPLAVSEMKRSDRETDTILFVNFAPSVFSIV